MFPRRDTRYRACALPVILLSVGYAVQTVALPTIKASGAAAIDRMWQAAVDHGEIPGVVAAVTNRDRIVYLKAFGKQDVAKGVPMSTDTMFRIASMTKPVTSVGVMMLYEQGRLRLDEPAGGYLPSLQGREVIATFNEKDAAYTTRPAAGPITIRHLLTHTSGLAYRLPAPRSSAFRTGPGRTRSTCRSCSIPARSGPIRPPPPRSAASSRS